MPETAPPDVQNAYVEALYESRRDLLREGGLRDEQLRQMRVSFARLIADVTADEEEGTITEERADRLRANIRQRLAELGRELADQLGDGSLQAAELAAQGHQAGLSAASQAAGINVDASFAQVPRQAVEGMFARRGLSAGGTISETFQTLIARNVREAAEDIDRALISGVARGVSNQRMTTEIGAALAGGDEELLDTLENLGPRGGRTREAIEEGVEIPEGELDRAKRLLYDARRIAVSEINNAHTAADDLSNARSPVVAYVRWTLSSRHDSVKSSPDVCDYLAQWDHIGEGPGVFHCAIVPASPHPFCMCWKRAVVRPESEWGDEMPESKRPSVASEAEITEALREWSGEEGRNITENFARRQREAAEKHIRLAAENPLSSE